MSFNPNILRNAEAKLARQKQAVKDTEDLIAFLLGKNEPEILPLLDTKKK